MLLTPCKDFASAYYFDNPVLGDAGYGDFLAVSLYSKNEGDDERK